jgi:hypothetical protein
MFINNGLTISRKQVKFGQFKEKRQLKRFFLQKKAPLTRRRAFQQTSILIIA